jgi:hypothetical protein
VSDRGEAPRKERDVEKPADPGTPWQRFVEATKRILSVSKEELEKREAAWRKKRAKKRRA